MPEKSQVKGDSGDPSMTINMAGEFGWTKGPCGEAKPPQKSADKKSC